MAHNIKKIEKRIQVILGTALLQEMQDARLKFVTITHAQASADFSYAKVYVSILGDEEEKKKRFKLLKQAKSYLQKILAKELQTKKTPEITFFLDESLEKNLRMSKIFEALAQENQESQENLAVLEKSEEETTSS